MSFAFLLLAAESANRPAVRVRHHRATAQSVVLLFMSGGPSLPQTARHADKLCLIRSMTHRNPVHGPGEKKPGQITLTGFELLSLMLLKSLM